MSDEQSAGLTQDDVERCRLSISVKASTRTA